MKLFKEFTERLLEEEMYVELTEATKDDPKVKGTVSNNTKGVLHEILTGFHLNGGKHMENHPDVNGQSAEQIHDKLKSQIHPDDYARINARAKKAADDIRAKIQSTHPGHKIVSVTHTSKAGDTEKVTGVKASQKQDSSDIYVTTKHPKTGKLVHHGVSLKVSDNSSSNVPVSNLGMEHAGEKAKGHYKEHQDKIYKEAPELKNMEKGEHESVKEARKAWARANPEKHKKIKSMNRALLSKVAASHAEELNQHIKNGNYDHVVDHLRTLLHAHKTPAQEQGKAEFFKHTTFEPKKGTAHNSSNPGSDYEHILRNPQGITVEHRGSQVIFKHNGKKFASQAHKLDSQSDPLSSLKSAGRSHL